MKRTQQKAAEAFDSGAAANDGPAPRTAVENRGTSRERRRRTWTQSRPKRWQQLETRGAQAFGEFRRQSDTHAAITMSDTSQRITSSLASLEAQNLAACDARRQTLEEEVGPRWRKKLRKNSGRASARSSIPVWWRGGAVEDHSKATRERHVA